MNSYYKQYLQELADAMAEIPLAQYETVEHILRETWKQGRRVFLLGNGGSAATASHLVCDLAKSLSFEGRPLPKVIALTDNVPLLTAYGNDISYEHVFAGQLANLVEKGDVVIAISASGNSPNVLRAVELANERGAITIGLTGYAGGKLKGLVEHCMIVPCENMQQIEDGHLIIGHALFSALRDKPFDAQPDDAGAVPSRVHG